MLLPLLLHQEAHLLIDCSPRFSGSPPITRMRNAFNHFICCCAAPLRLHLQFSLSLVLPNSKIFYLLCTYDPHAGTGLSPIGLSESDTSGCCCWSLFAVRCISISKASAAWRRMLCMSDCLCMYVCETVVFCLFARGYSECHCNSPSACVFTSVCVASLLLTGIRCRCSCCTMMDCVPGPICVSVCTCVRLHRQ